MLGSPPDSPVNWGKQRQLVKVGETYYTLISHEEIDGLIGTLMQMCDLMGDVEQRNALKSEIKQRTRRWMDDQYWCSGYDKNTGVMEGREAKLIIE